MDYRISDLRNFLAASSVNTISQAALILGVSQPSISDSIKRLETQLGSKLFYRSRSGIQLTSTGRAFVKKSQNVFDAISALDAEDSGAFLGRSLKVGIHSSVAGYLIPDALTLLQEMAPDFQLIFRHDASSTIQSMIQSAELDLGVIINPVKVPDIIIKEIGKDFIKVWKGKENLGDLKRVFCDPNLIQTQTLLRKWKVSSSQITTTSSLELICQLVSKGLGYGIVPERIVKRIDPSLQEVPDTPVYKDEVCVVYRPEFGKEKYERLLIDALISTPF